MARIVVRSDDLITFARMPGSGAKPPLAQGEGSPLPQLPPLASLVDLGGRVALVTGAAQGFGFACARRLAEAGASVMLVDRRPDRLDEARERLASVGHAVTTGLGDVSVEADVERLMDAAVETLGRLDVVVNNAGV